MSTEKTDVKTVVKRPSLDKLIDLVESTVRVTSSRCTFLKWPCLVASIVFMFWCIVSGSQIYHYAAAVLILAGVALMDHESGGNVIKKAEDAE